MEKIKGEPDPNDRKGHNKIYTYKFEKQDYKVKENKYVLAIEDALEICDMWNFREKNRELKKCVEKSDSQANKKIFKISLLPRLLFL